MTRAARDLLKRALALSESERRVLAHSLLDSLEEDDPKLVAQEWKDEIAKRVQETLDAGDDAPGDEWPVVRARIVKKLGARRSQSR